MADYTIPCHSSSATVAAGSVTAGGGPYTIGGVNNSLVALRFQTATGVFGGATEKIKRCRFNIKIAGVTSGGCNADVWAADYGAAITVADYAALGARVTTYPTSGSAAFARLKEIFDNTAVANDSFSVAFPPRFVNRDTGLNGGYTDIEIRSNTAISGSNETTTIYGSSATGNIGIAYGEDGTPTITGGEIPTLVITTLTPSEEIDENEFNEIAVRDGSYVAFDIETTRGFPVKAKHMLDFVDTDLDGGTENLFSEAVQSNRQRPGKSTTGREGAGGSVSFHLTPEVWVKLLRGWFKVSSTTGAGPYTHTLVPASFKEVPAFTFVRKFGNSGMRNVYRGCSLGTLTVDAGFNQIVRGSLSVMGRQEFNYMLPDAYGDADEYILNSAAGYDNNATLSFNGAEVHIDSVVNYGTIPRFSLTLNNGISEIEGLRRRRDITGHIIGGFTANVSFDIYFENDVLLRNFAAQAGLDDPWKAGTTITFNRIDFKLEGPDGAAAQEIVFTFEKLMVQTIRKPIGTSEGGIILPVAGLATLGNNAISNIATITVLNDHPASFWDASTDEIVVVPAGTQLP
jgi:hypothetical protein